MEIHAYNRIYLDDAMKNLGEAFDYAINDCSIDENEFMELFISSGYASSFGKGNPRIVSGLSGCELVDEILQKANLKVKTPLPSIKYDYSKEYWAGWILAYYQWVTNKTFKDINRYISVKEIIRLYYPLHEANEEKFVETLNIIIQSKAKVNKLQIARKNRGLSQSELADQAGVNVRTLQEYESGAKDINKASAKTVLNLANVIGCKVEDILN